MERRLELERIVIDEQTLRVVCLGLLIICCLTTLSPVQYLLQVLWHGLTVLYWLLVSVIGLAALVLFCVFLSYSCIVLSPVANFVQQCREEWATIQEQHEPRRIRSSKYATSRDRE